jgi:Kef-type K+ transport system membrane component KefB
MTILLIIVAAHFAISLTAIRWWMRPLLLRFSKHFGIPPCSRSDFVFFCLTWGLVLMMFALYLSWEWVLGNSWIQRNLHKSV